MRGAAAFWLWNWVQASHWQTTSSMALFMLGQRNFHVQATVTSLFLDGIDAVDVGPSPIWQEE